MKPFKIFVVGLPNYSDTLSRTRYLQLSFDAFDYANVKCKCAESRFDDVNSLEAMIWTLNQLQDSDAVIVDLYSVESNPFALFIFGALQGINASNRKQCYVIGIGDTKINNVWIKSNIYHFVDNADEAVEYMFDHLIS